MISSNSIAKPISGAAALVLAGLSVALSQTYRVKCGGDPFVDSRGNVWEGDRYFEGGSLFGVADTILETADADQPLYRSERWNDPALGNLKYTFKVREGEFKVRLHFAEIWDGAFAENQRVFDVNVNGQAVAQAFDIYARAGARKPVVLEHQVVPSDGQISVELINQVNHAKISGIEVLPLAPFRADKAPYRIHCGGDDFIDDKGNYWEADGHFTGGSTYVVPSAISGTEIPALYRTERWNNPDLGNLAYEFGVEEGSYTVRLHFAEIYFQNPAERTFGYEINGVAVEQDFDIIAAVGANTALVKEYPATAVDGKIKIEFRNGSWHAKISGIEILPADPVRNLHRKALAEGAAGTPSVRGALPGTISIQWPASGGFTAIVRDLRGGVVAVRRGAVGQTVAGLIPGLYLVELRSGRLAYQKRVLAR